MFSNMKATLLARTRIVYSARAFAELVLWRVPGAVRGSDHGFKYRLAYVVDEVCVVRYDNEVDKGDHRRIGGNESAYRFSTPERLVADFRRTLRGGTMKTVVLEVRPPNVSMASFAQSWKSGKAKRSARIAFATPELLWQVLTAKRWELLKKMCGAGPISIREAARRVERDVKAVHSDVTALLNAGVLDRAEGGGVVFPFDAIKVEFLLEAA